MIKTIIFDLGGVIVPLDFQRGYRAMEAHCKYPAAEIPETLRATNLVVAYETGQISNEEFVEKICAALELKVDYDKFRELWSSIFLPHTLIPESLLASLRDRYRLLLLSNTNDIHFEMIRGSYPLLKHFDEYVLSYKVGAVKPSPEIYSYAISRAECEPSECFFTDDIPAYIEGARRAGIDAVQFQSEAQLRQELQARGVEV